MGREGQVQARYCEEVRDAHFGGRDEGVTGLEEGGSGSLK